MDMAIDRKLILKQSEAEVQIYASTFYYMELNVAVMLRELNVKYDFSETAVEQRIRKIEQLSELELDEMQRTAVKEAVRSGLLVITGGLVPERLRRLIRSFSILNQKAWILHWQRLPAVQRSG